MIDWDRVMHLRNELGDDDFGEVVDLFLRELKAEIEELKVNHSSENLEASFHSLKGCALNLGLSDLAKHCQAGEMQSRSGPVSSQVMDKALSSFEAALPEYQELLASLKDP